MKKNILLLLVLSSFGSSFANDVIPQNNFEASFATAYKQHPQLPRGILEAVAYHQTRFQNITDQTPASCIGLPRVYGPMGLTLDGKGYFNNSLMMVAQLAQGSPQLIKNDPHQNILAYAAALDVLYDGTLKSLAGAVLQLSELPEGNSVNEFARESMLYMVLDFMNSATHQANYNFADPHYDLAVLFGHHNLQVLRSSGVTIAGGKITNKAGKPFLMHQMKSVDYGPAIWNPAPTCNYSSRSGTAVSAITIHTIQGSYSGAIGWSQNCSSNVSYHYVVRSADGQVTQMVDELDKAWHVGSANPYTIGYEHEGYVNDPSWYTTAMYNASAGISIDVTNSGYGISPLRTYFGTSSSGTNTLGGCTHIKGHQHYPSQSHTDPGINWDWERYYQLINANPTINSQNNLTGNFYDSGGPTSNYTNDERELTLIAPSGATTVTVTFSQFDLEANWDYLYIYDGSTTTAPLLGIYTGTTSPGTISSNNGTLLFEFRSDCATTNLGWSASCSSSGVSNPTDNTPPTTTIAAPTNWITNDFTCSFSDMDNAGGSGVDQRYYQVINYDGVEWRANDAMGFFSDNFDATLHMDWTNQVGVWNVASGKLNQTDETNTNSNMHAALTQQSSNAYLYHWVGAIDGTGTNRRAGFHFFCDDATLTNRGNSYFVWFRVDDAKVQLYETINDVFTLQAEVAYTFVAGAYYDFKVTYDPSSGAIESYVNNTLAATWVDPTPLIVGNSISFRSGNATYAVDKLKVYKSRGATELITVGPTNTAIDQQNQDPLTAAAKVKSIAIDSSSNVSAIEQELIQVDWTAPSAPAIVNDGLFTDLDNTTTTTEYAANWSTTPDLHSDISRYWYAIGTTPGATDIVPWTDNWFNDTVVHQGLNLAIGQVYYFSVKAENGAGLLSSVNTSDGLTIDAPTGAPQALFNYSNTQICLNDSVAFTNSSANATTYNWTFLGGSPTTSNSAHPKVTYPTSGTYTATLIASGPGGADTTTQQFTLVMDTASIANFTTSADTVYLPSAIVYFTNASQFANGFNWDFGDGSSSNDIDPWHEFLNSGTYTTLLTAVNGNCPNDTASKNVVVLSSTGLQEASSGSQIAATYQQQEHTWQVMNVGNAPYEVKLAILDASGRLVNDYGHIRLSGGELYLMDMSRLTNGYYIISIVGINEIQGIPFVR